MNTGSSISIYRRICHNITMYLVCNYILCIKAKINIVFIEPYNSIEHELISCYFAKLYYNKHNETSATLNTVFTNSIKS